MAAKEPFSFDGLLAVARAGNAAALGELLEHFRGYLELLTRLEIGRRLQTKVDSTDLVQETFLEAHRNLMEFRGTCEAEFAAWLRAILGIRVALFLRRYLGTHARDVRREQQLEVNLEQTSERLGHDLWARGNSPSQSVIRREQGVLLASALAELPEDYREVIVLRQFEELSFLDIAQRMERSVDSVQKLWVRALARLRTLLVEEE